MPRLLATCITYTSFRLTLKHFTPELRKPVNDNAPPAVYAR